MNADRLQVIKARLEALRGIRPNTIKIPATEYEILRVMNNAYSDLRDLITALEAAQQRIATLEAEVQRVTSDQQYIIGFNDGYGQREIELDQFEQDSV